MRTSANRDTVLRAIKAVNKERGYQISLNRDDQKGRWFHFTIKSPSGIPGSRYGVTGRRLASASWHAHGYLFDKIFELDPEAVIVSLNKTITKLEGNWEDCNVGSIINPVYFSELSIV